MYFVISLSALPFPKLRFIHLLLHQFILELSGEGKLEKECSTAAIPSTTLRAGSEHREAVAKDLLREINKLEGGRSFARAIRIGATQDDRWSWFRSFKFRIKLGDQ